MDPARPTDDADTPAAGRNALGVADGPPACNHGGDSFRAIGDRFDELSRRHRVINADVLDAWFDPAPGVVAALAEHLPWLARTSPPTDARGLSKEIATTRGVPAESLVPGAGSSDLIFRALPRWLTRSSRVLLLEPTYGEYAHLLEGVLGCRVDRLVLRREQDFDLSIEDLAGAVGRGYDLIVLVKPNNPTGRLIPRRSLEPILAGLPARTRVWIDEAYIDYAGGADSLEDMAWRSRAVVVCKSMSKAYALSGLRVAYLCCHPETARALRAVTPPWVVGLPAQVAAVHALRDPGYYASRHAETRRLRAELAGHLARIAGVEVVIGHINAVLCHLPGSGPDASEVAAVCRDRGLFLRVFRATWPGLGGHAVRMAVKDAATNSRMAQILAEALGAPRARAPREHVEGRPR
jgi:histidinol-phosphate/aromatic aminotransferase/cobyric acid decarboxylase-like protein